MRHHETVVSSEPSPDAGRHGACRSDALQPRDQSHDSSGHIFEQLDHAFKARPDSGGIIQGKRHFRRGKPHVRLVMVPSPKNGGLMPCEGRLEALMALSLEIDPDVIRYRCQPIALPSMRGSFVVPDFAVERPDGTYAIADVKPEGRLSTPSVIERMQRVRSILKEAFIRHRIVTEKTLEAPISGQIREALRRGATTVVTESTKRQLLSFEVQTVLTVGTLRQRAIQLDIDPRCIEKLALQSHLKFSTVHDWNQYTRLEVNHGTDTKLAAGWGTVRTVRIAL